MTDDKYGMYRRRTFDDILNEELSDLLESFDDAMAKILDVWNKEEEE